MNLAVVELETHAECVHALACLLADEPNVSVSLFLADHVYQEIENQLYIKKFKVAIKPKEQSCKSFLAMHHNSLQQQQIIIINTLHRHYQQYPIDRWSAITILRIHNARFYFDKWRAFSLSSWRYMSWSEIKYNLKLLCVEWDWHYVNKTSGLVDFISFMDSAMQQYASEQKWVKDKRVLDPLPLTFSGEYFSGSQDDKCLHVAVPGSVDKRRKDYDFIVDLFRELLPEIKQPIKLTLLGKADVKAQECWIKPLLDLASAHPHFSFQWYNRRIEQEQFDATMQTVDFLLAPVQPYYYFKTYKEQYGQTKMSGINADIIRYLKPCFLPDSYLSPEALLPLVVVYKSKNELIELIKQSINTADYKNAAEKVQLHYARNTQKQTLMQILQTMLNQKR